MNLGFTCFIGTSENFVYCHYKLGCTVEGRGVYGSFLLVDYAWTQLASTIYQQLYSFCRYLLMHNCLDFGASQHEQASRASQVIIIVYSPQQFLSARQEPCYTGLLRAQTDKQVSSLSVSSLCTYTNGHCRTHLSTYIHMAKANP